MSPRGHRRHSVSRIAYLLLSLFKCLVYRNYLHITHLKYDLRKWKILLGMWVTQESLEKPHGKNVQERNLFNLLLIEGLSERRERSLDILYQTLKIKFKMYRKTITIAFWRGRSDVSFLKQWIASISHISRKCLTHSHSPSSTSKKDYTPASAFLINKSHSEKCH